MSPTPTALYRYLATVGAPRHPAPTRADTLGQLPAAAAEPAKEAEPVELKDPSIDLLRTWTRAGHAAKCLRTVTAKGPDWGQVVRRKTTNTRTGDVIEDVTVANAGDDFDWYSKLPAPTDITTTFWYTPVARPPDHLKSAREKLDEAEKLLDDDRKDRLPDPNSLEHLMTHLPKHPDCKACQIANLKASHARRVPAERKEDITEFGQEVTGDTLVSKDKKGHESHRLEVLHHLLR